jgi:beta-glucosidase/6-phospho-beta-glucosidase/beta-galactosidase
MKKMNHTAARIGNEWARIEPSQGASRKGPDHYRASKRDAEGGDTPEVTQHHFANR